MWEDIKDILFGLFFFIAIALCIVIAVGLIVYGVWAVSTGNIPRTDISNTTNTLNATTSLLLVSSM